MSTDPFTHQAVLNHSHHLIISPGIPTQTAYHALPSLRSIVANALHSLSEGSSVLNYKHWKRVAAWMTVVLVVWRPQHRVDSMYGHESCQVAVGTSDLSGLSVIPVLPPKHHYTIRCTKFLQEGALQGQQLSALFYRAERAGIHPLPYSIVFENFKQGRLSLQ